MTAELASRVLETGVRRLEVEGATDRGTVRAENQDAWTAMARAAEVVIAVADGMGGHAGGREAAEAAIAGVQRALTEDDLPEPVLRNAVREAGLAVGTVRDRIGGDPGTTLTVACVDPDRAVVANVGDSRAYLIRTGGAQQVTDDHSWVGEEIRAGRLDRSAARRHARRNLITRAVMGDPVEPDVFTVSLRAGDVLLLCTDGVWEPLSDEMLGQLLTLDEPLARSLERVCEAALDAGGTDNVTTVATRVR